MRVSREVRLQATSIADFLLSSIGLQAGVSGTILWLLLCAYIIPGCVNAADLTILLDASSSMAELRQGAPRFAAERRAVEKIVSELPAGSRTAVHIFGGAFSLQEKKKSCRDFRELLPLEKHSARDVSEALERVAPQGFSPIAYALQQLPRSSARDVLLITDGQDTCGGKVEDAIIELYRTGLSVRVQVVAFQAATFEQRQLQALARMTGGEAFFAESEDELTETLGRALRAALYPAQPVGDLGTKMDASSAVSQALQIQVGHYKENTLGGPDERDVFRYVGEPGERVVIHVEVPEVESPLQLFLCPDVAPPCDGPGRRQESEPLLIPASGALVFSVSTDGKSVPALSRYELEVTRFTEIRAGSLGR